MRLSIRPRTLPGRVVTGGYILHSGLEKWKDGNEQAEGVHAMASGAYPFLKSIPPRRFMRLLAATEITTGAALLIPFVPEAIAGAALTGFAGGLVGLYARTPGMRRPGSLWPTQAGLGLSKDVWMLGIGLDLLADAAVSRRK